MKKILFVIPPYSSFDDYKPTAEGSVKVPTLAMPYGVLSIASYINKDKQLAEVEIFDSNKVIVDCIIKESFNFEDNIKGELYDILKAFKPDVIGISSLCQTAYPHLEWLITFIDTFSSDSELLIGGSFATNGYELLLNKFPELTAVCYGEGELPFFKLLRYWNKEEDYSRHLHDISTAWVTHKSLEKGVVPQHDFVENLDDIPIVDYAYFPNYYKYNNRSLLDKTNSEDRIELYMHTSRGCPYNCVFCANGKTHGKKIRFMSVDKVIETIKYYKRCFNMTVLIIEDDHFLSKKDRALEILNAISKFEIKVEFPNGLAVRAIDDEVARALKDAGVEVVPLAIESGSDYVLKEIIDKPLNKEQIFKAVNSLKKYDIRVHAFVVIGFPNEMDEHRQETLEMLIEAKVDWAYIFIAIPTAGSRLHQICVDNNYLINTDFSKYTTLKCNIKAPGVEPKAIEDYAYYMNIVVNFLLNSNFRDKKFDIAEKYFTNVLKNYKDHAVAKVMLATIYIEKSYDLMKESQETILNNPFWNYINKYVEQNKDFLEKYK